MNYHNILHDDMRNGEGLRVTLFVSGCQNQCDGCQNPQTWDMNSGLYFDDKATKEIFDFLSHNYIDGITFSGGDPLHYHNVRTVFNLCREIKEKYPEKTIWLYTGYTLETFWTSFETSIIDDLNPDNSLRDFRNAILKYIDVLVDGKFVKELADVNYHWAGSTNQRVIDVQKTLASNKIALYET